MFVDLLKTHIPIHLHFFIYFTFNVTCPSV